jgi:hypothetical protein
VAPTVPVPAPGWCAIILNPLPKLHSCSSEAGVPMWLAIRSRLRIFVIRPRPRRRRQQPQSTSPSISTLPVRTRFGATGSMQWFWNYEKS